MSLNHGVHITCNDTNWFNTWSFIVHFILHIAASDEIVEAVIRHSTSGVGAKAGQ